MTEAQRPPRIAPISERESGLRRGLGQTQMVMIGLGGAIGTGLFMGSGLAIGYAGPAVILSYVLAGFVALVMVFSLSEMAVVHPTAGSFGTYAETYLNPWAGFVVRYTYWIAQVIAIGGEAVAAGLYMGFWFPGVPVWMWALAFCADQGRGDRAVRRSRRGEPLRQGTPGGRRPQSLGPSRRVFSQRDHGCVDGGAHRGFFL